MLLKITSSLLKAITGLFQTGNADGITMLADGNGIFTKALGLEMDGTYAKPNENNEEIRNNTSGA